MSLTCWTADTAPLYRDPVPLPRPVALPDGSTAKACELSSAVVRVAATLSTRTSTDVMVKRVKRELLAIEAQAKALRRML